LVAFGYRSNEVRELPRIGEVEGVQVFSQPIELNSRKPVSVSLGMHLKGVHLPKPDLRDVKTLSDGVKARMGKVMPTPKVPRREFLPKLQRFVQKWIKSRGIMQTSQEEYGDVEEWLARTNYTEARKAELRECLEEIENPVERDKRGRLSHFDVKLFGKDEGYIDWKHLRGIYAREDNAKLFFGPWFKLMEEELYKQPEFIKHVPVRDRPRYIYDRLYADGARYIATDYSSFEAHFSAEIMEHCEFVLYRHFLDNHPIGKRVLKIMKEVLQGDNRVINKFIKARIAAKRQSGEMCTSLGNGFSNLMWMSYICEQKGIQCVGVVEGDDGLFSFVGQYPETSDFTDLGFIIKLDVYDEISRAGFCGNLFDPQDLKVVTDPYKVFASFGWTTTRYLRAKKNKKMLLLRCKALSLAHQYPGCPLVSQLAHTALRLTRSYDVEGFIKNRRDLNIYEREKLQDSLAYSRVHGLEYEEPGMGTRLLFEELYGISVSEQRKIEEKLRKIETLQEIDIPSISDNCPLSWQVFHDRYVCSFNPKLSYDDQYYSVGRLN